MEQAAALPKSSKPKDFVPQISVFTEALSIPPFLDSGSGFSLNVKMLV